MTRALWSRVVITAAVVGCTPVLPSGEGEGEGEGKGEGKGEGEGEGEGEPVFARCTDVEGVVDCDYDTVGIDAGLGISRDVHIAVPAGTAPPAGWPTVVFFQGSLFSAELAFHGESGDAYGQEHVARTAQALLDAGFAVLAPEVLGEGATAWQTNVPPQAYFWEGSSDDALMLEIFAAIDDVDGVFGHLDGSRLFATGISSGGFMTSRMALSYAGRFEALAIHSAGTDCTHSDCERRSAQKPAAAAATRRSGRRRLPVTYDRTRATALRTQPDRREAINSVRRENEGVRHADGAAIFGCGELPVLVPYGTDVEIVDDDTAGDNPEAGAVEGDTAVDVVTLQADDAAVSTKLELEGRRSSRHDDPSDAGRTAPSAEHRREEQVQRLAVRVGSSGWKSPRSSINGRKPIFLRWCRR